MRTCRSPSRAPGSGVAWRRRMRFIVLGGTRFIGRATVDRLHRDGHAVLVVHRGFGALLGGAESDPVPLDEQSPVRAQRYPYRGQRPEYDDYDKLDVEEVYARRQATVLRLPMVYGEHDRQRREEFILRRVRAGRTRIPVGAGTWLACRGYVGEIARAIRSSIEHPSLSGEILNLAEH